MKRLVVYYSLTGNTQLLAKAIASAIAGDILPIKTRERNGFLVILKSLWAKMRKRGKIHLLPLERDPSEYQIIFIGAPVWASTCPLPLKTFFADFPLRGKKIALFCTYRLSEGETLKDMALSLPENEILGEIGFLSQRKKREENIKKAQDWAKMITKKTGE